MKVTFLATSGELGGAERCLLEMLASLRAAAPDWPLALVSPAVGPLVARAEALGVRCAVLPFPPSLARVGEASVGGSPRGPAGRLRRAARIGPALIGGLRYARRLRQWLAVERPDVVHANGLKMHLVAARATPARASLLWHLHDYLGSRTLSSALVRRAARAPRLAVANSRSVADDWRAVCGGALRIETFHNAVDLSRFSPEGPQADLDALAGLPAAPAGTIKVGLVSTFARWKGHETFIDAVARLDTAAPIRAYVIGGPVYATAGSQFTVAELIARAAARGLAARIGFTGFVEEPADAMRALDVVVHASTEPEPFGMVIAEAMACGCAVVASRGGGAAEIIEDGRDALTVEPGDAGALADVIARLASDAGLRGQLGREARVAAEARFDRARYARELIPLYREIAPGC